MKKTNIPCVKEHDKCTINKVNFISHHHSFIMSGMGVVRCSSPGRCDKVDKDLFRGRYPTRTPYQYRISGQSKSKGVATLKTDKKKKKRKTQWCVLLNH